MGKKYFVMVARTIPKEYILPPGQLNVDDHNIYLEHTKKELSKYAKRGLPVYTDHMGYHNNIDISKKVGNFVPLQVKGEKRGGMVGRVVDTLLLDDGPMLNVIEIVMETNPQTTTEKLQEQLKHATVGLVKNNFLKGVSFSHVVDTDYHTDLGLETIKKIPLEIGLVKEGLKKGSDIIYYWESETPYLPESEYEKMENFDHMENVAQSLHDINGDFFDKMEKVIKEKNSNVSENLSTQKKTEENTFSEKKMSNTGPPQQDTIKQTTMPALSADELQKLLRRFSDMERENLEHKKQISELQPNAEAFVKLQEEKDLNNRKKLHENFQRVLEGANEVSKFLKENPNAFDDILTTDLKQTVNHLSDEMPKNLQSNLANLEQILKLSNTSEGGNTTSDASAGVPQKMKTGMTTDQLYDMMNNALAETSMGMFACGKYMEVLTKQKNDLMKQQAAANINNIKNLANNNNNNNNNSGLNNTKVASKPANASTATAAATKKPPVFFDADNMAETLKRMKNSAWNKNELDGVFDALPQDE